MKRKCDQCNRPATHHVVEIVNGKKIEKHLCDKHAVQEGLAGNNPSYTPINELLSSFVKMHSGEEAEPAQEVACENCGLTWAQFQERSLLGCPECYRAFERLLVPLLERTHEGGTHHLGKVPRRSGAGEQQQLQLMRLRKRLTEAVEAEDYELAAHLRDEIGRFEEQAQK